MVVIIETVIKIQDSIIYNNIFIINISNLIFTDNTILTRDHYKRTYIHVKPLSQRPPKNVAFLKTVLKHIQAKDNVHAHSRLIYKIVSS